MTSLYGRLCVCLCPSMDSESVFFLRGRFHIHIFLLADLTPEELNWSLLFQSICVVACE